MQTPGIGDYVLVEFLGAKELLDRQSFAWCGVA
jgi:hypothetical protein